jgi:hypothetical protein
MWEAQTEENGTFVINMKENKNLIFFGFGI